MNGLDLFVQKCCKDFGTASPKFPHTVSLEIFPADPIYQKILDLKEFHSLLRSTLINVHNCLAHHNPNITIVTKVESDKTSILVTPPKHYLEEEGMLH